MLDLPAPGVYKTAFAHKGFQTFARDGFNLSVGFDARVDVTMNVGQATQTVEVSGSNPVVDTVNTSGGTPLQLAEIALTPKGVGLQELFPRAFSFSLPIVVKGIDTSTAHDLDTAVYMDTYALAEAWSSVNHSPPLATGLHSMQAGQAIHFKRNRRVYPTARRLDRREWVLPEILN